MNRTRASKAIRFVATLGMTLVAACAPMKTIDSSNAQAMLEDFSTGRTKLGNGPGGIKNYVDSRGALRVLYATKDWSALAKRIIQIDYAKDLAWFYLAESAEGLGFHDAAKVYYINASTSVQKCKGGITGDDCDGFNFPNDIVDRLTKLRTAATTPAQTVPPRASEATISAADAGAIMADRRATAIASATGGKPPAPPVLAGSAGGTQGGHPASGPVASSAPSQAPVPATANAPVAPKAPDIRIAGVRPGMTKQEATAALKHFDSRLMVIETYTAFGNGMLYSAPRSRFQAANIAFFSQLVAIDRGEFDKRSGPLTDRDLAMSGTLISYGPHCESMTRGPREKVSYKVLFSVELVDPKVVLVDELRSYCAHDVTVPMAVKSLYDKYSHDVVRSLRMREDGLRVTPDTYPGVNDGAAFLEWRYTAPLGGLGLPNQIDVPMDMGAGYRWIGNVGGVLAVHAEIRPADDLVYMGSVRTILWDDDTMHNFYQRQNALVGELDRLGLGIGQLNDRALASQVRIPAP